MTDMIKAIHSGKSTQRIKQKSALYFREKTSTKTSETASKWYSKWMFSNNYTNRRYWVRGPPATCPTAFPFSSYSNCKGRLSPWTEGHVYRDAKRPATVSSKANPT